MYGCIQAVMRYVNEVSEVTLSNVQVLYGIHVLQLLSTVDIRVDCTAVDNKARPTAETGRGVSHRYERRGFAVVASSERLAPNTRSRKRSETSEDSLQRRDTSHVVQIGSEHTYSNT